MSKVPMTKKLMILGVDGMDPRLTNKYVAEGKMPAVKEFIERGASREDLMLLGGHPTVTPSMWTTLSTGCYANVHGITDFNRQSPNHLDAFMYNLDSRKCTAEQSWNGIAEAGYKTLVWHWPGCAWPPTSDSENLFVVDGTTPGALGTGTMEREGEFILGASEELDVLRYVPKVDHHISEPCVIEDVDVATPSGTDSGDSMDPNAGEWVNLLMDEHEGMISVDTELPISMVQSPIRPAEGWENAPDGAKEFVLLLSQGFIRRPCLIAKNDDGVYDTVYIYSSKKDAEPLATMKVGVMVTDYVDKCIKNDQMYNTLRFVKLLEMEPDGSKLKMFVSRAMDTEYDECFSPKRLYKEIVDAAGYFPPSSMIAAHSKQLVTECTKASWDEVVDWQAKAMQAVIEQEGIDVVFSHQHNIDMQEHKFIRYMKDKGFNVLEEEDYCQFMEDIYVQTDRYLGQFLHYLDEGWTIMILSDHAQVCSTYTNIAIGDPTGVNIGLMKELGYTVLKKDEDGNDLREIDWSKTRAVAGKGQHIYINLKGRWETGIVDPADKYELEEQIITDLYSWKHPVSGKRAIAVALHNKDAVLLGQGGPEAGDIVFWVAEGYNQDHGDSLSTTWGEKDTSVSPIFIAAGPGIKPGRTERIIRQIDVAPTVCTLLGVRMPAQCEGAPVYQILDAEM